jgi:hypothetical protein
MACCSRAHSALCASASAAPKTASEAESPAKAAADARILLRPNALRMRVFATFISSIASFAIPGRPRRLGRGQAPLEPDIAA